MRTITVAPTVRVLLVAGCLLTLAGLLSSDARALGIGPLPGAHIAANELPTFTVVWDSTGTYLGASFSVTNQYGVGVGGCGVAPEPGATKQCQIAPLPPGTYSWTFRYGFMLCSSPGYCSPITLNGGPNLLTVDPPLATLTVSGGGSGSGTITTSSGGINCGSVCSATYSVGSSVTLTASPLAGSTFVGWSNTCGASPVCTITITGTASLIATFARTPPPAPPTSTGSSANSSTKTTGSAARLPSSTVFTGQRSIKDTRLTQLVYRTLKGVTRTPRLLAVACWTDTDFEAVSGGSDNGDSVTLAFWKPSQPRWLHVSGRVCGDFQQLIGTRSPTGRRASSVVTALHEATHAYGIKNEAQANCYAVQLVPAAGRNLGMRQSQAAYLGKLALNYTRRTAPPSYWNNESCRTGGKWDLGLRTVNF